MQIRILHGHHFPESDEKMDFDGLQVKAVAPSGEVADLTALAKPGNDSIAYTPRQAGLHRVACTADRGVVSRTPQGVKKGGRDVNPDAAQAFRRFASSLAYLQAGAPAAAAGKPIGLEAELSAARMQGAWVITLFANGKGVAGVSVQVFPAGAKEPVELGKTDAAGVVRYAPSGQVSAPLLFTAEWKAPPPAAARYDSVNYSTSLYVQP